MTLALGLLARGGVVIAADREESDGTQKLEQSKIGGVYIGGRGCIAVTGAGNGQYLDSLTESLVEWFSDDKSDITGSTFGEDLRRKHYEFYKRCVLPFAPYEEPVDYELLVCFDSAPTRGDIAFAAQIGGIPGKAATLWTSHKLSVLKADPYAAVGSGRTLAKSLLAKFWVLSMPLEIAISLAVYVMYQAKRTIKDVGLDTDL